MTEDDEADKNTPCLIYGFEIFQNTSVGGKCIGRYTRKIEVSKATLGME